MVAPICRICNSKILENEVKCANCDSVHHEECFQYGGKCSIFACGGQKYEKENQIFLGNGTYLEEKKHLPAKNEITDLIIKEESLPTIQTQTKLVLAQYEDLCKHFPPQTMDKTIIYKASKELVSIKPSQEQLAKHEKKLETIVLFFIDKTKRTREDYNVLDRCLEDEYHENLGFIKLIYRSCINEYVLWKNEIKTKKDEIPSSEGHINFYSKFGALTGGFGGVGLSLLISMLNPNLLPGLIMKLSPIGLLFGLCLGRDYGKKKENEIATSNVKLRMDLDKLIRWYPKEINSKYAKLLCAFTESNNLLGEYNAAH